MQHNQFDPSSLDFSCVCRIFDRQLITPPTGNPFILTTAQVTENVSYNGTPLFTLIWQSGVVWGNPDDYSLSNRFVLFSKIKNLANLFDQTALPPTTQNSLKNEFTKLTGVVLSDQDIGYIKHTITNREPKNDDTDPTLYRYDVAIEKNIGDSLEYKQGIDYPTYLELCEDNSIVTVEKVIKA